MGIGIGQIILITIIVFLIFGAGKVPTLMADLAKGIKAFKKGMADEDDQSQSAAKSHLVHHHEAKVPLETPTNHKDI